MRRLLHVSRTAHRLAIVVGAVVACLALPRSASAQSESVEYYGQDAVGSIRIVFDVSGTVTARQDYAPFGRELVPASGLSAERFGGNTTDAETDQGYFHVRQYQTRTGRFGQVDPIYQGLFQPQGWNRYSYALNNPTTLSDLAGLQAPGPSGCTTTLGAETFVIECPPGPVQGGGSGATGTTIPIELWLFLNGFGWLGNSGYSGDSGNPQGHGPTTTTGNPVSNPTTGSTPTAGNPTTPTMTPVPVDPTAWDGFKEGCKLGAFAAIDGAIPFVDPLESAGYYDLEDSRTPGLEFSKTVGGDSLAFLATFGAGRLLALVADAAPAGSALSRLNHNEWVRIGYGPHQGKRIPRIAIGANAPDKWHIDLVCFGK